jgi:hypothetical protein
MTFNPWYASCGFRPADVVSRQPGLSAGAKLVYARLVWYAGERGYCWPRQELLCADPGGVIGVVVSDHAMLNGGGGRSGVQSLQKRDELIPAWSAVDEHLDRLTGRRGEPFWKLDQDRVTLADVGDPDPQQGRFIWRVIDNLIAVELR